MRALPVGPAFHFHLEQAEIDPELKFFAAIETRHFADFDRAGFVRPLFQEAVQVEAHRKKQSSPRLLCQRAQEAA